MSFCPVVLSTSPSFERDRRTVLESGQWPGDVPEPDHAEYIESVLDEEEWQSGSCETQTTACSALHSQSTRRSTFPRDHLHTSAQGEGTSLFRNVLVYSQETNRPLVLQAINAKVAILYARAAEASGRRAGLVMDSNLYGEWETVTADELVERLQTRRGTIDMIFPL